MLESFAVTVTACALRSRKEDKKRMDAVHEVNLTERGHLIGRESARDPSRWSWTPRCAQSSFEKWADEQAEGRARAYGFCLCITFGLSVNEADHGC